MLVYISQSKTRAEHHQNYFQGEVNSIRLSKGHETHLSPVEVQRPAPVII